MGVCALAERSMTSLLERGEPSRSPCAESSTTRTFSGFLPRVVTILATFGRGSPWRVTRSLFTYTGARFAAIRNVERWRSKTIARGIARRRGGLASRIAERAIGKVQRRTRRCRNVGHTDAWTRKVVHRFALHFWHDYKY